MLQQSRSIFFYALLLITPFLVSTALTEGYETPKLLFLLLGSGILGMAMVFSLEKTIAIPKIPQILFFLSLIVVSIFSSNISYSLFGDFPRYNLSVVYFLCILVVQIVYLNYFPKFNLNLVLIFISSVLSIISFFDSSERIISTIGQPNFLGILIGLGLVATAKVILEKEKNLKELLILLLSLLIQIIVLFKTSSISAIFITIVGILYVLIKAKKYIYLLILSLVILGLFLLNPLLTKKVQDSLKQIQNNPNLEISDSLNIRLYLWESSIQIWRQNPKTILLGVGPGTFSLNHEKFRNPKLNLTSEWGFFFDKPHNLFIQILVEGGLLLLISFCYLIIHYFREKDQEYKLYVFLSLIFFIWNWNFIYHGLIFFLMILSRNQVQNIRVSFFSKILLLLISAFLFISLFLFISKNREFSLQNQFFTLEENIFYYQTQKPEHLVNGINYYQINHRENLKNYLTFLKSSYLNNLPLLLEVYKIEKQLFISDSQQTKEVIRGLRPDLIDWHEAFK